MIFPLSVVHDLRPTVRATIFAAHVDEEGKPGQHRFAVLWDEDFDERVLGAVLAIYYRHPQVFRDVLFYAEHKAWLDITALRADRDLNKAVEDACSSWVADAWTHEIHTDLSDQQRAIHALFQLGTHWDE